MSVASSAAPGALSVPSALSAPLLPTFVLRDQHGRAVNTLRFRGRRNLILLVLPRLDAEAVAYLRGFVVRREEWAWLHTAVVALVPPDADVAVVADVPFPVLRDSEGVRDHLLPGADPTIAVLFVADTTGAVWQWQTARRVSSLPEVATALAWAWEVARPRGACDGGVAWARPTTTDAALPAAIGRFTVGGPRRTGRYRK